MSTFTDSRDQRVYEKVYNAMSKLSTEQIVKGCRVFEVHGMRTGVYFSTTDDIV